MCHQYDSTKGKTSGSSTSSKDKDDIHDASNRHSMRLRSSDNIQKDKHQTDSSRRNPSRSPPPPKEYD